jgi:hypothetical protein
MGVGLMTYLSTLGQTNLVQTQASLSAPTTYHYNWAYNSTTSRMTFGGSSLGTSVPYFTRTADGIYYDYVSVLNDEQNSGGILPDGLEITIDFQRSNTTWADFGGLGVSYYPTETKVGSDSTVGTISRKFDFTFDNQTNHDYILWFDTSSTSGEHNIDQRIDSASFGWYYGTNARLGPTTLSKVLIPSFTTFRFWSQVISAARYMDAFYLQDLGITQAYTDGYDLGFDDGYDDGYQDGLNNNPNILLSGFQAMVGILVNFALMVLNLSIFGVSLLDIFAIMALLVGVIWILKLVRG